MAKTIRVGGVPEHFNLPWHLAMESGAFADADLAVEFIEVPGGTGAMTRMLNSSELDAAVLLTEGAVADICKGSKNRLVKVYADSPLIWGIHVTADSDIDSVDEIQGKRYAISRRGSGSHLMAIVDAAERDWPTQEMDFVVINNLDGAREALASNQVDVFFWEKYMTKPLVDSGEFRRVGVRIVPWPSFVVSVRQELLGLRSQEIKNVLEIVQRFAKQLRDSPDAVQRIASRYGLKSEDTQEWFDSTQWSYDFDPPRKGLTGVVAYLDELNLIPDDNKWTTEDIWFDLNCS